MPEDRATIIASLRMYQDRSMKDMVEPSIHEIATDNGNLEPLNFKDIDGLCEEISSGLIVVIGK